MRRRHKNCPSAAHLLTKCADCGIGVTRKSLSKHICEATTSDAEVCIAAEVLDIGVTSVELTVSGDVCAIPTNTIATFDTNSTVAPPEAQVSRAPGPDLPLRVRCPDCDLVVTREESSSHDAVCGSGAGAVLPARVRCPDCHLVLSRHQLEGHHSVCGFKPNTSIQAGTSTLDTPRLYRARGKVTGRTTRSKCPNCDFIIFDVDLNKHNMICSKMCNAMCNIVCISLHG